MMRPEAILAAMNGVMAEQAAGLSQEQRVVLAQFLAGQTLEGEKLNETRPVKMCAEWESRFDFNRPPAFKGWGITRGNTRFIDGATAKLPADAVPRLEVKWAFAYPNATRTRSQPSLAGGAVFVGSQDGTVYALDAATGCARWTFRADAEVRTAIVVSDWALGDTAAHPSAYFGDTGGTVYRLDAVTGQEIWKVEVDPHPAATVTATPTLYDGRLYVPVSSTEWASAADPAYECCTFRGSVVALDAETGKQLWKTWTIPQEPHLTGDTNPAGTPIWQPAGAPVWNSPTIDEKRDRLYVGTGESYTSPASPFSDAILALDLKTGKLVWRYQATAGDAWNMACMLNDRTNCPAENGPNFDFGAPPMLVTPKGGGDIIVAGQKSGYIHALDASTGHLIWRRKIGLGAHTSGIHWGMAAYDDVLFAANSDTRFLGRWAGTPPPGLFALDTVTGGQVWFSPNDRPCPPDGNPRCDPGLSAAVTAIPGVVFTGGYDGWIRAYEAGTGKVIWSFDTARDFETVNGSTARGGSIEVAGPVVADGTVYVNSGHLYGGHMPGNVLLALAPASP
ncbi:MAG: PQQ-binding-like beta-propeller repeat protein [Alphaproteobacteria bacterium]|nr:PQQ-binding-like beta-propeller repeat protein [Alphaproteobacteria bacterium]